MISGIIGESCTVFLSGEALVKNQRFPFSVLIYSSITRHLILFMHNLVAYFLVLLLCGVSFNFSMLLLVVGIILVIINCAWISLIIAIACMRFRDLKEIVLSILQISMFVTPVFWAASQLQGNRAFIVHFNPLHHLIEIVREPMLGKIPDTISYLFCICFALSGWVFAYWFLDKKRDRLAYWY
jgi:ABC-type polysaccharide/polyol phosphate export permease